MPSRRELLSTLGSGAVALLAGCSGGSSSSTRSIGRGERAVWTGERDETEDSDPGASFVGPQVVGSSKAADELSFAEVDGVDGARTFLDRTDFDAETVFISQRGIDECYRLELCSISWRTNHVTTNFARLYRDADETCSADESAVVASSTWITPSRTNSSSGTSRERRLPRCSATSTNARIEPAGWILAGRTDWRPRSSRG